MSTIETVRTVEFTDRTGEQVRVTHDGTRLIAHSVHFNEFWSGSVDNLLCAFAPRTTEHVAVRNALRALKASMSAPVSFPAGAPMGEN